MCGIIGIISTRDAVPRLVESLVRLEYRGYDSAGLAVLTGEGLESRHAVGRVACLDAALRERPVRGMIGVAHTRWATHGKVALHNTHPLMSVNAAVVHNGIIENHRQLRRELEAQGQDFAGETDTEVILHLLDAFLSEGLAPERAFAATIARLEGSFALAALVRGYPGLLGARHGSPLAVGRNGEEMFLGSDALAMANLAGEISYLEDGDMVVLSRGNCTFPGREKEPPRSFVRLPVQLAASKAGQPHFMLKEMYEQPHVVLHALSPLLSNPLPGPVTGDMPSPASTISTGLFGKLGLERARRMTIVACGTACYAGLIAKYWFARHAGLFVDVDIASEFRYREPVLDPGELLVPISQSGETSDTLAALRHGRKLGARILSLVNVPGSSIAREADICLPTGAGPEIGVASTKAMLCQLMQLAGLVIAAGRLRKKLSAADEVEMLAALLRAPQLITATLEREPAVMSVAGDLADARSVLYVGRGVFCPVAYEGALKLKELSYIHAEGYAAGEMKHGPIALVEQGTPVVAIAPHDGLFHKTCSNLEELKVRGARLYVCTDTTGAQALRGLATVQLVTPSVHPLLAPLLQIVLVQLLAYHVALRKGLDVDKPRNLAKSVTVE